MAADELILTMTPSPPGMDSVQLRVSPECADELQEILEAEGVYQGRGSELAAGATLVILIATLGVNGWPAISAAVVAFINRNQNVKVELYESGTIKTIEGLPLRKAERLIEVTQRNKDERDAQWRQMIGAEAPEVSTDPSDHRPGGPATGE